MRGLRRGVQVGVQGPVIKRQLALARRLIGNLSDRQGVCLPALEVAGGNFGEGSQHTCCLGVHWALRTFVFIWVALPIRLLDRFRVKARQRITPDPVSSVKVPSQRQRTSCLSIVGAVPEERLMSVMDT